MITTAVQGGSSSNVLQDQTAGRTTRAADQPEVNRFYEMFDPKNWEAPTSAPSTQPASTTAPNPAPNAGPTPTPSAEALFGPSPWLQTPTGSGPDGKTWSYNPLYFATKETAEKVAQMVGGQVIEQNQFCPSGPLTQAQPNEVVQLANGRTFNAGEFVGLYTHGYPQSYVDRLIQQELTGEVKG